MVNDSALSPSQSPLKKKVKRYIGLSNHNTILYLFPLMFSESFGRYQTADRDGHECKRKLNFDM